ncbi:RHS repeat protein, partial [bacterium]|nr:RHS repeat protein [bacterium]
IEIIDKSGNRVAFTPEGINHSSGQRVQFTRDNIGRITQMQVPGGETWRYQYDTNGDLAQVTYPGSIVATFGYSQQRAHFLETINDPFRGPSLRTEYDETGRVTATIDAAGNRREQHWDPGSFSGTITDARGNVTKLTYNALGNLVRREDPLGGVTVWEFRDSRHPNLPTLIIDPRGNRTAMTYDATGNLVVFDRPLASHRLTYNPESLLTRIQYGTGLSEDFLYDTNGKLSESKSLAGNIQFTYSGGGLLTSILDEEDGMTRLEYDSGLPTPTRIILPDGTSKRFTYDLSGRLTSYTDPMGGVTSYEYDSSGRRTREIDPTGAATMTTYDSAFP